MKRKILFIILIIMAYQYSFAQGLQVIYEEIKNPYIGKDLSTIQDPKMREVIEKQIKTNPTVKKIELQINKGVSISSVAEEGENKEIRTENRIIKRGNRDFSSGIIYRNQAENKMVFQTNFFGKDYVIEEPLTKIEWKIGTNEKNINGYNCIEATGTLYNQNLVAWYCPDIPVNEGPNRYWGLPGLILEVVINNGTTTLRALSINEVEKNSDIKVPTHGEKISKEQYDAMVQAKIQEMSNRRPQGNGTIIKL